MKVLMVGVGRKRLGGMWTVAENYLNNKNYCEKTNLKYIATSTNGSKLLRLLYMLKGYVQIFFALNFSGIDLVHIHMAEKGSTFRKGVVAKMAKKHGCRVIIHLHAGAFMKWYQTLDDSRKARVCSIFQSADKVLVLGEYWKNQLSEIVDPGKISVLYNGIRCLSENPYRADACNVVYLGVFKREKGIYDLIEAIERIDSRLPEELKMVLCGIDLEGNIKSTIDSHGLAHRFILKGWVDGLEKSEILNNAMLNLLPSYHEGLSMTVIEAMTYGVPVITTKISTMEEILGKDDYLFEPGDTTMLGKMILDLTCSEKERLRISGEEFLRVRQIFDLEIMLQKTLEIYHQLLQNS